jgi:hypothetical protein
MKLSQQGAIVALVSAFLITELCAGPFTIDQLRPALKAAKSVELPAKAVSLVQGAKLSDKEVTAINVITVVSEINPSAVPAVVGSISKAEPKLAPKVHAQAVKLQPTLAPDLKAGVDSIGLPGAAKPGNRPDPSPGHGKKKGHYKNP